MYFGRASAAPISPDRTRRVVLFSLPPDQRSGFEMRYCNEKCVVFSKVGAPVAFEEDLSNQVLVIGDCQFWTRNGHSASGPSPYNTAGQVISAFIRYGEDLSRELNGDFAFAVWDARSDTLVLSRDHFGVRQLFYRVHENYIWFSDQAKLIAGGVKPRQSRSDVADLLLGTVSVADETSYAGVMRLPPAHSLVWRRGKVSVMPYWRLDLRDRQFEDPEPIFRQLFQDAVACRLGAERETSSLLSGGIDSTSICMAASAELRGAGSGLLRTYSCVYNCNPDLDETQYIDAAVLEGKLDPVKLPFDGDDPLEGVAEAQLGIGRLFLGAGLGTTRKLLRVAGQDGRSIVLDGHGGDEVVSFGTEHLRQLGQEGRWLQLMPLILCFARLHSEDPIKLLANVAYVARPTLTTRVLRRLLRVFVPPLNESRKKYEDWLSPELLAETGGLDRLSKWDPWHQDGPDYARKVHKAILSAKFIPIGFELLDWAARQEGVVCRYPFFDRDLVEFCVNLPGHEKIRGGRSRSIIKRALRNVLPSEVAKRNDKADFSGEIAEGLRRHHGERLKELKEGHSRIKNLFNQRALARAIQNIEESGRHVDSADASFVWRAASVAILVDENGDRFDLDF